MSIMPRLAVFALTVAPLAPSALVAGEGMWMPQQVPELAADLKQRGLELDPAQIADLLGDPMGAIVSLGGCSASFVSPDGLIATNHHCVYGSIQFNTSPERDLIKNGFLAKTREEELATAPGTYVYVTSAIRDVTQEVQEAALPREGETTVPDHEVSRRIERARRELVDACEKPGGVRCNVGSFFEGAMYLLTTQTELQDVRLVYAPAEGIGNYGGEIDNWMWPRHTGDFAFLRAYASADGKAAAPAPSNVPYRPKHWLKVARESVDKGDLVWIAGYPGRTFRYRTASEVVQARDFQMPRFIELAKEAIVLFESENARGKEVEIANYSRIRGLANPMKKYEGVLEAMRPGVGATVEPVEAHRRAREAALRDRAAAGSNAAAAAVEALDAMEALSAQRLATRERDFLLGWLERSSTLLSQGMRLYRNSVEQTKPDIDRANGFRDRDRTRFDQGIARAQRSIDIGTDRAALGWAMKKAVALPADQRIVPLDQALAATGKATTDEQVAVLVDNLFAGTKLQVLAERQAMSRESTAQLEARGDSMMAFAKQLYELEAANEQEDDALAGASLRLRPKYLEGLRELQGGTLYPDANSTLRLTFCEVDGFRPRDGERFVEHTTLPGVIAKATGEVPFDAPAKLLEVAKQPIPEAYQLASLGTVPVNFLATCDITGGNSGSAVLNGKGELVGLAFDGNWEGVVSDYLFMPDRTRTISVNAVYMRFVMDLVDDADHLLKEMGL